MADNKKFQVALDLFTIEDAMRILEQVGEYVDIIEVGTPLMVAEGARAVRTIKDAYPTKTVFADIKVMDGGGEVPKSCIQAGCDMFSVLCASDDATPRERRHGPCGHVQRQEHGGARRSGCPHGSGLPLLPRWL